jgi:hypothetical protein
VEKKKMTKYDSGKLGLFSVTRSDKDLVKSVRDAVEDRPTNLSTL